MPKTKRLDDLPPEIIFHIGKHLPNGSLAKLALCSRYYYEKCIGILYSHQELHSKPQLTQLIETVIAKPGIGCSVRTLDVRFLSEEPNTGNMLTLLGKFSLLGELSSAESAKNAWRKFEIITLSGWAMMAILICLLPQLENLKLPCIPNTKWHQEDSMFIEFFSAIAKAQRDGDSSVTVLSTLKCISIAADVSQYSHFTKFPFLELKSLTTFKAGLIYYSLDTEWQANTPPLPNIKILMFSRSAFIASIVGFLNCFPCLERFEFGKGRHCLNLADVVEGLLPAKKTLKYLWLWNDSAGGGTDQNFVRSLSDFERLEEICIQPAPWEWSDPRIGLSPNRLCETVPHGLKKILLGFELDRIADISLYQLLELVTRKDECCPGLNYIEMFWYDDDENAWQDDYDEMREKCHDVPLLVELWEACWERGIRLLLSHRDSSLNFEHGVGCSKLAETVNDLCPTHLRSRNADGFLYDDEWRLSTVEANWMGDSPLFPGEYSPEGLEDLLTWP
ncbi:hypothetical protein DSL72_001649 [Monilinia vaccinii-corymbosi]|uniref:F-box domain-containing protein n=1 Tax=Monilinia vaccinii-corymbosi TaxID=61207 RepID=A0A8A3P590_9HELO|nr:hypothetical protein DSL72_001649 [Monilinia vaccinii-corymbosi]